MITKQDLDDAIVECLGKRNPDSSTCMMLAAFYTIKDHLYPEANASERAAPALSKFNEGYSFSPGRSIEYEGESDFADAVRGRDLEEVLPVIDELMGTIKVLNPRLYSGVLRRLR